MSRIPNTLGYFVLGAALCGWSSAPAASPSYTLNRPVRTIPSPAGILPAEWNVAQWQNGVLVFQSAAVPCTNVDVPNLVLADASGTIVLRHTVWPVGATTVQMLATAVSKQHVIAVSGAASSPSAAEIPFVQEIRPDGTLLREIRTGGFLAFSLAYDDKGDLWMAGSQAMEQGHWPPHQILRRYRDGALVSEHLPYSGFLAKYEATTSHKSHPAMHGNEGRAFLVPAPGGVGLWSPGTHEWIEVGSDGAVRGRWQAPYPAASAAQAGSTGSSSSQSASQAPRVRLVGLAVTSTGEVIATIHERNVRNGLYRLDKATSSWQEIAVPEGSPVLMGYVAGADGADVVYRDQADSGGWAIAALTRK